MRMPRPIETSPLTRFECALDARAREDLPPTGGKEGVAQQPNETHRVEQRAEEEPSRKPALWVPTNCGRKLVKKTAILG